MRFYHIAIFIFLMNLCFTMFVHFPFAGYRGADIDFVPDVSKLEIAGITVGAVVFVGALTGAGIGLLFIPLFLGTEAMLKANLEVLGLPGSFNGIILTMVGVIFVIAVVELLTKVSPE